MKVADNSGPLEKAVAGSTAIVNSVRKQLATFHPKSKRYEFASCFLKEYEKFKLRIEKEYIKVTGKDSPPLPSKEEVKADVLPSVN